LTESAGNPRGFPESDITILEETYPYILREKYNDAIFWQLSFGNITTEQLCSQAFSYLRDWEPDIIIVHSGLNDCRPEAFTDLQKTIITDLTGVFFSFIKKHLYNPRLIKFRNLYRVSPKRFRKTLNKFKMIFTASNIIWLELAVDTEYEKVRPGVNKRIDEYNKIISDIYGENRVPIQDELECNDGFATDKLHWNRNGHHVVANVLIEKINALLNTKK
jgi:hypothetical protein